MKFYEQSKIPQHSMSLGKHNGVSSKYFCFWSTHRLFDLVFLANTQGKNIGKTFLNAFFLGTYTVQTVLKQVWMPHSCYELEYQSLLIMLNKYEYFILDFI